MSDETMVNLLARELAKARTRGNVYMDGAHNPLPSEYVTARRFLASLESQNQALQERAEHAEEALQMAVNYRYLDDLAICTGCWSKASEVKRIVHEPGCWMADKTVDSKTGRKLPRPTQETDPE